MEKKKKSGPRRRQYMCTKAPQVCTRIAAGEAWADIHAELKLDPRVLFEWPKISPAFAEGLAVARETAAQLFADEALKVARATDPKTASADRLRVGILMDRAALDAPQRFGGKAPVSGGPEEVVFRVRQFEPVPGPDGATVLREVFPEGEA